MIKHLLSSINLNQALAQVIRNRGAAGVDGMSIKELPKFLKTHGRVISSQIAQGAYRPQPIMGVEIPKSNGKTRLLGIPTVVDRVVQQALHQTLQPVFEPDFHAHSYGFRPGRNAQQAAAQSLSNINSGYQDIVDIDLKAFFDQVDHSVLLELIYRKVKSRLTLKLLRSFLRAPMQTKGKLIKRRKGVPQGSPLSPLLSNIILNELDKELEKRGHRYVRYADDFSIYVRSKVAAKRVGNSIYRFLRDKLHLPINREKSGIRRPVNFQVLGFGFVPTYRKGVKGKYQIVVDTSKWRDLKSRLKELTRRNRPMTFDERIEQINLLIRGWINYFKPASMVTKLESLDHWLRNRLRACIWFDWKRPEKRRRSLIRLGVEPRMAYAWSRTRMGRWAVACSPILRTTITVDRLKQRGYLSMKDYYLERRSN